MSSGEPEPGAVLEQRAEFIEAMRAGAMHPRDLSDTLDVSQSTVTRGLRELESVGWVQRTDDGYVTTLAGRLAYESYRDHRTALETIQGAADVFEEFPADAGLSPAVFSGDVTVHLASELGQYALTERLVERIAAADQLYAAVPALGDSAMLDAWESVLAAGGGVSLVVAEQVVDQLRASERDGAGAVIERLRESERCRLAIQADSSRLGVLVVTDGEETELLVTVYASDGSLQAVIDASPEGREWARQFLHQIDEQTVVWPGEDVPALGESLADQPDETAAEEDELEQDQEQDVEEAEPPVAASREDGSAGVAVAEEVRADGFRQLSERYFATRAPFPITRTLRVGASLIEVADGQTLPREHQVAGEHRELPTTVREQLLAGEDCVVVGPPGSGKSTVCMQVAYRWFEADEGPVLYRESETGIGVESPARLEAVLRETSGHTLVVVEDVMRSEAAALFRVVEAFADDPSVSFLVDARREAWLSTNDQPNARHAALRHTHFTAVSMPAIDDRAIERFVTHFEQRLSYSLPAADEIAADLPRDDTAAQTGELLLLLHQLGTYVAASTPGMDNDSTPPTSLQQEVTATYHDLKESSVSGAREVGFHVAVLVAAGFEVTDELVYALAEYPAGPSRTAINDALEMLDGTVVYSSGGSSRRVVHDTWGVWFLQAVQEAEGDQRLHHRFATSVNALFALVDDGTVRERIAGLSGRQTPQLERIEGDAVQWLEHVLAELYGIGEHWHTLTGLYGQGQQTRLEFPESCPARLRAKTLKWRVEMFIQSGSFAAAQAVLEEFDAALDDVADERAAARLQADQTALQAFIHRRRGDFDAALDCADHALAQYRAVDDRQGVADTLQGVGLVRWHRDGDVEAATADLSEALDGFRAVGDRVGEANCMNNLGIMARARGELDTAAEWFEQSYAVRRSIEAGHHIVDSLINLGVVARDRGNLDAAIRRLRRAVERAHEYGGTDYRAHSMRALGNTLHRRGADGDLEDAEAYLEEALAMDRAAGIRFAEGHCLRGLAAVNRKRGDLATARECIADAEAAYAEAGADRDRALATRERGRIAYAKDDYARARRLLGESVDALDASDRRPGLATTRVDYAKALLETGDSKTAATQLEAALAWFREIDADRYIEQVERLQGETGQQHQPSTNPHNNTNV